MIQSLWGQYYFRNWGYVALTIIMIARKKENWIPICKSNSSFKSKITSQHWEVSINCYFFYHQLPDLKQTGVFTDIGGQDVLVSWLYLFRSVILSSVNALREHISCRLWQYYSHTRTSPLIVLGMALVVCIIRFFVRWMMGFHVIIN